MLHGTVIFRMPGDGNAGAAVGVIGAVIGVRSLIFLDEGLVGGFHIFVGDGHVCGHMVVNVVEGSVIDERLNQLVMAHAVGGPVGICLGLHLLGHFLGVRIEVIQVGLVVHFSHFSGGGFEFSHLFLAVLHQAQLFCLGQDYGVFNGGVDQIHLQGIFQAIGGQIHAIAGILGGHGFVFSLDIFQPDHAVLTVGGKNLGGIEGIVGVHLSLQFSNLCVGGVQLGLKVCFGHSAHAAHGKNQGDADAQNLFHLVFLQF